MQWLALHHLSWAWIAPLAIILMYVLKRNYENVDVPSTLLWQQVLRDQQANRPWQKLQRNLLLLMQLLVAFILVVALLQPAVSSYGVQAAHTVIVIDSSGSMWAEEEEENGKVQTRWEFAIQEAERMIDRLSGSQQMTIIEAAGEARVIVSQSTEPNVLRDAIHTLEPRLGSIDDRAALSLAMGIVSGQADSQIVWLGDGNSGALTDAAELEQVDAATFIHEPLGAQTENVSVQAFTTELRADGAQGVIHLENHGQYRQQGQLRIYDHQNTVLETFDVELNGQESVHVQIESLSERDAYRAEIAVEEDALPHDNVVWSVPHQSDMLHVALVSAEGNHFLHHALRLNERIHLEQMTEVPSEMDANIDIWIFDRLLPESIPADLSASGLWFWAPGLEKVADSVEASAPNEAIVDDHPLFEHIDWSEIHIGEYVSLSALADVFEETEGETDLSVLNRLQPLVQAGDVPMVVAGEVDGRRTIGMGFALHHSDFALHTSFPIFVHKALDWLSPVRSLSAMQSQPGERISLSFTPGSAQRLITHPDGEQESLSATGTSHVYTVPDKVGLYEIQETVDGEQMTRYLIVQLDRTESQIAPAAIQAGMYEPNGSRAGDPNPDGEAETDSGSNNDGESGPNSDGEAESNTGSIGNGEAASDIVDGAAEVREQSWRSVLEGFVIVALLFVFVEWGLYQRGY